eukprot:311599-Rhodomonas_salina.3
MISVSPVRAKQQPLTRTADDALGTRKTHRVEPACATARSVYAQRHETSTRAVTNRVRAPARWPYEHRHDGSTSTSTMAVRAHARSYEREPTCAFSRMPPRRIGGRSLRRGPLLLLLLLLRDIAPASPSRPPSPPSSIPPAAPAAAAARATASGSA